MTPNTLQASAARHARERPDAVAVVCEGREVTFAELHRRSSATARALLAAGVTRGTRVGYLGRESEHYYDLALACAKAGAVLVPANWRLTAREVEHVLTDSGAELLFAEGEQSATLDRVGPALTALRQVVTTDTFETWRAPHESDAGDDFDPGTGTDDPVAQLYTSGTTGLPKGVVLAHRTFFTLIEDQAAAGVRWFDWRPGDVGLSCFPGLHTAGFGWFMHAFNSGATTVVMRMFVADEATRIIERRGITLLWAAPAMLRMMLAEPGVGRETFRTLRKTVYSGSPIDRALLLDCIDGIGGELIQGYSSAEAGSFLTALPPGDHTPDSTVLGSAGRPCPGVELAIVDDDRRPLPSGAIGRVAVRTRARFLEYWHLEEATAASTPDGWLLMGDTGFVDTDGYLFLLDRVNDTIIVAGQNIYPVEVERAILEHPSVAEAAVFGVPDARWGESVRAAVVPRTGETLTPRQLMVFLRGRIADFKIPTGYELVDGLPRNPTGKVLRRELKARHTTDAAV